MRVAMSLRRRPVALVVMTAFAAAPMAVRNSPAWAGSAWAGPAWTGSAGSGCAGSASAGATASYGDPFSAALWGAGPPWWHPRPVPSLPASRRGTASL